MKNLQILSIAVLLSFTGKTMAQDGESAKSLVMDVIEAYSDLNDYSVDIQAEIDMPAVHIPPMNARLYYRRPDMITFKTDDFMLLPKQGVAFDPALFGIDTLDASVFRHLGEDTLKGFPVNKVEVKFAGRMEGEDSVSIALWIDKETPIVRRLMRDLGDGGSLEVDLSYIEADGFQLPSSIVLALSIPPRLLAAYQQGMEEIGLADTTSTQEDMPDSGTIKVVYSAYEVNKGIPDEVFESSPFERRRRHR